MLSFLCLCFRDDKIAVEFPLSNLLNKEDKGLKRSHPHLSGSVFHYETNGEREEKNKRREKTFSLYFMFYYLKLGFYFIRYSKRIRAITFI
jgi:hypothetical protein